MPFPRTTLALLAPTLLLAAGASAQPRFLLADRTSEVLWLARDTDNSGAIDASEVSVWFDATNAHGTPGLLTIASLAVRRGGVVLVGDSDATRRAITRLRDSYDGDAQDPFESAVVADPLNASGVSVAAPQGLAFDAAGFAYVANASNAAGLDAVYRLVDLDADGRFMSAGEITEFVGAPAFGTSSGNSFNPAEIVFIGATGYMRNSGSGFHGVYRFEDLDLSGRADDPGEFTGFWDSGDSNASGVLPGAGLALEVDRARPRSLYTLQIATGGIDQLVRLNDVDGDGTAHQPEEATIVFENPVTGFSAAGILSLPDGRVVLSDASGDRLLMLTDLDADNAFTSKNEAVEILSGIATIGTIRQIALLPCPGDWTMDLTVNSNDISAFLADWLASIQNGTILGDADASGQVNSVDISAFLQGWLGSVVSGC